MQADFDSLLQAVFYTFFMLPAVAEDKRIKPLRNIQLLWGIGACLPIRYHRSISLMNLKFVRDLTRQRNR